MSLPILPASVSASPFNPVTLAVNARKALDTSFNNYLVRPVKAKGIGGFLFDYDKSTKVKIADDITDHFTEKNTFFQDHAARRPIELTMSGFIAELVLENPTGVVGALATLQSRLTTVDAYLGKYTPTQIAAIQSGITKAQNAVTAVDQTLSRAENLLAAITKGSPAATKQQKAFATLMALRDSNYVFNVDTPFGFLAKQDETTGKAVPRSFMIQALDFDQGEETKQITDIIVSLKEMQFVEIESETNASIRNYSGRAAAQRAPLVNKGLTAGVFTPFSMLQDKFGL